MLARGRKQTWSRRSLVAVRTIRPYRLGVDRTKPCGIRANAIVAAGNDLLDGALRPIEVLHEEIDIVNSARFDVLGLTGFLEHDECLLPGVFFHIRVLVH
jgi:hypothetical protein